MNKKIFPRVLLVDDDDAILDICPYYLAMKGIKTEVVSSGELALEKVKNYHYDAIIIDINMPTMDGITLSKIVHKNYPVIMISGQYGRQVASQIVDLCECYVDKSCINFDLAPATFKAMERFEISNLHSKMVA